MDQAGPALGDGLSSKIPWMEPDQLIDYLRKTKLSSASELHQVQPRDV